MKNNGFIVTGANSYLGKSFVKYLAGNSDSKLLIVTRSKCNFSYLESKNIYHLKNVDLLNPDDLNRLSNTSEEFFKKGFNIINCTGYFKGQNPFNKISIEESIKILEGNFTTVLTVTNQLIPLLIKRKGGHIIGFSCNSVKYNYPQMAPFTAAKSALESLMRTIANEFYEKGIYANTFQLSTLLTKFEKVVKPFGDHQNWLKPEDVVKFVIDFIHQKNQIANGNSVNLYKYSSTFFKTSYFERIRKNN